MIVLSEVLVTTAVNKTVRNTCIVRNADYGVFTVHVVAMPPPPPRHVSVALQVTEKLLSACDSS